MSPTFPLPPPLQDTNMANSEHDQQLSPSRPFFLGSDNSTRETDQSSSASVLIAPAPKSPTSPLRPRNRQESTQSITYERLHTGLSTRTTSTTDTAATSNPFNTPASEQANPFSPPASVASFSLADRHHFPTPPRSPLSVPALARAGSRPFRSIPMTTLACPKLKLVPSAKPSLPPPRRPLTLYQNPSSTAASASGKRPSAPRPRSTMLALSDPIEKPWLKKKDRTAWLAYFLTYGMTLLGVAAGAVRIWTGWKGVPLLGNLCLVLDEQFQGNELDIDAVWMREADMGGFGNGEFEMTTASTNNSFVRNNNLYLLPTLTSDVIGHDAVFDGYTFNLTGCTNTNLTACGAVSNRTAGTIINPVMSARISTKGKKSIRYGRVEVRAKLPRGDWGHQLRARLAQLGSVDVAQRGGEDVRMVDDASLVVCARIPYLRARMVPGFHVRTLSSSSPPLPSPLPSLPFPLTIKCLLTYSDVGVENRRIYVDSRLQHMIDLRFTIPFFERGDFPASVSNASQEIILANPWAGRGNSAPFDQPFYLIMDVAIGGTNGWFPDGAGNKPWLNGAISASLFFLSLFYDSSGVADIFLSYLACLDAMQLFAEAQDEWYPSWPQSDEDRAMIVDWSMIDDPSIAVWDTLHGALSRLVSSGFGFG
ncbi:hypothetical protein EW146_g9344 [Bondarzewia mesenterica]|uniref:GH16 domain-containing protein n=1 Tax=Bondarzewia mesenterica TaxID=1095465 RepID=A0A4S4L7M0_9AGAM|nr:hypothetical protein EW146_g9344 [Bondarzewia mesenterica]